MKTGSLLFAAFISVSLGSFKGSAYAGAGSSSMAQQQAVQTIHKNFESYKLRKQIGVRIRSKKLPEDLKTHVLSFMNLDNQVLERLNKPLRACVYERDHAKWLAKVLKIERLFKKYNQNLNQDGFIPLPTGGAIAKTGIDQEFWVTVMGNNPSKFKEQKYCPDTYREITVKGRVVPMCPNLPVETVAAQSDGNLDSDVELIAELNRIYENAGKPMLFRRHTRAEYRYADTANETQPKLADQAHLAELEQATPYWQISSQSPSGEYQSRSITNNTPNSLGFRRSGVWEWAEDLDGSDRALVGGSWRSNPGLAASGFECALWQGSRGIAIGPSRLVRYQ